MALGVPFPPLAERFERLEETLRIVRQMWSDDDGPFEGRHFRLAATVNVPQALSRPHPPIMIGGSGERKTLRLVAQYADACNIFARGPQAPAEVAAKLAVLRRHCDEQGRDYYSIRKTILYTGPLSFDGDGPDQFAAAMADLAGVGVEEVHVMPMGVEPVEFVERLGEHVVPLIAAL